MKWFLNRDPRPTARLRLVCLPYAGGGAAVYKDWHLHFDDDVEVLSVQLPGRGWRIRETPGTDLSRTADDVTEALRPLTDRPLLLFGHSYGAWLGLLVSKRLEALGTAPLALAASGRRAPSHHRADPPLRELSDEEFVKEIQSRYGPIHPKILAEPDILALTLPTLRADVAALETYDHGPGPHVECPVAALGGTDDPIVPVGDLASWRRETGGPCEVRAFPGGHFYFEKDPRPLANYLRGRIDSEWTAEAGRP